MMEYITGEPLEQGDLVTVKADGKIYKCKKYIPHSIKVVLLAARFAEIHIMDNDMLGKMAKDLDELIKEQFPDVLRDYSLGDEYDG